MSESAIANLNPKDRALFATSARLLSCLVTESLVDAHFYPHATSTIAGWATICLKASTGPPSAPEPLAIIPLHHYPLIDQEMDSYGALKISLLDPLDMLPSILVARIRIGGDKQASTTQVSKSERDPFPHHSQDEP